MITAERATWGEDITRMLRIRPTIEAMQRYLLFASRCSSVEPSCAGPENYHILVRRNDEMWRASGVTAEEAMGRVVLMVWHAGGSNYD